MKDNEKLVEVLGRLSGQLEELSEIIDPSVTVYRTVDKGSKAAEALAWFEGAAAPTKPKWREMVDEAEVATMSDRRSHWDDDLIDAVRVRMTQCPYEDYNCEIDADAVYAVIAAVEDWLGPVEEMVNDGERVQRVREIHQPHRCRMSTRHIDCFIMFGGECSHEGKCQVCREKYPCATICALVGDGDE